MRTRKIQLLLQMFENAANQELQLSWRVLITESSAA
jgi:hypothetical protein